MQQIERNLQSFFHFSGIEQHHRQDLVQFFNSHSKACIVHEQGKLFCYADGELQQSLVVKHTPTNRIHSFDGIMTSEINPEQYRGIQMKGGKTNRDGGGIFSNNNNNNNNNNS